MSSALLSRTSAARAGSSPSIPPATAALLELVLVPTDEPTRVIHADYARRSFIDRMRL